MRSPKGPRIRWLEDESDLLSVLGNYFKGKICLANLADEKPIFYVPAMQDEAAFCSDALDDEWIARANMRELAGSP